MNEQPQTSTQSLSLFSNLPHHLFVQILLRLPVRSLIRFKSVCKSWRSLISDPKFGKSHFDLAAAPTHRYLVRKINDSSEIESLDFNASLHDESSAIVKLTLPFPSPLVETIIDTRFHQNPIYILGSCRGFVVVAYERGSVVVWNPSTGLQKPIPDISGEVTLEFLNGFGYHTSTDDYLLVCVSLIPLEYLLEQIDDYRNHISYFSLKTNSFTEMDDYQADVQYVDIGNFDSRVGSYLNDALHWLVISFDTKHQVIIAFDLEERTLSEIPISHHLAKELTFTQYYLREQYYLRVMGECLSLCYPGNTNMTSKAEIWMMKEYKVQSSWTKLFAFSTCDVPRNVFFPKCFTNHHGVFGSNGSERLMILNDKGRLLDQHTLLHLRNKYQYIQVGCGMYRESLLSLPNDFEEASEDNQLTNSLEEASEENQLTNSLEEASEEGQ
ncbi:F-box/kelch-repeat protein At3g23880-like [Lotus japonicus]|uniref:F-box/kelch-repeat protein At3g23880-like n=1 Tax=Lotus japonicus TaxID=34305 RepID=UPI00258ABEF4|nr:F-box/kelch-repeat protein At3g23880-like [Lotus japonicus]